MQRNFKVIDPVYTTFSFPLYPRALDPKQVTAVTNHTFKEVLGPTKLGLELTVYQITSTMVPHLASALKFPTAPGRDNTCKFTRRLVSA